MLRKFLALCSIMLLVVSVTSFAQTLDGSPFTPGVDPNIDMNIGSWEDSAPRYTHGTLVERDILTKGNPLNPPAKGAVLRHMNRYTYASLKALDSTSPTTLKGEQEILYILSGKGKITAGKKTADLYDGIAVLMPPGIEFTITNTGNELLTMYLISEPVPEKFQTNKEILVKDENIIPYRGSRGHWAHIAKELFMQKDGLATLEAVLTVSYAPMTIGQPHSHDEYYGAEEVWTGIKGTSIAFIGKQIRMQPPGTAYNIPPDGKTPHANINTSDEIVKLFYFAVGAGAAGSGQRFKGAIE